VNKFTVSKKLVIYRLKKISFVMKGEIYKFDPKLMKSNVRKGQFVARFKKEPTPPPVT
jgi:hypothetical protein